MAVPESPERRESSIRLERLDRPESAEIPEALRSSDKLARQVFGSSHESYRDYLKSIRYKWPEYEELSKWFEDNHTSGGNVQISDILIDGSFSNPHKFHLMSQHKYGSTLNEIQQVILKPPENVRTRIVLLGCGWDSNPDGRLLNLIGLAFDIEPVFLWSLIEPTSPILRRPESLRMGSISMKILKTNSATSVPLSTGKLSSSNLIFFHQK